jgi:hypothetical protein
MWVEFPQRNRRRANLLATPSTWVIAFNTTGGRMVLESYFSQPLVLVLMICQPQLCLDAS